MFTKAVIIFACLYTVTARTFIINAYEDDTNEINNLSDDPVEKSVGACMQPECNDFCRRRRYARGECVGPNQCRCFDKVTLETNTVADTKTPKSCDLRSCEQNCRRIGYPGGACVNGRCKCDILYSENISSELNPDVNTEYPESCDLRWCEQNCRRMGFPGGVCVNGRCKCDIRYSDNPAYELNSDKDSNIAFDTSVRSCMNTQCNDYCRRRGFGRGVCISSTVCRCSGRLVMDNNFDDVTFEKDSLSSNIALEAEAVIAHVRSCINSQCNDLCRRLGFISGVCMSSNECRCSGRLPRDATSDKNNLPVDVTFDTSVRSCINSVCNDICRLLGFATGVCISPTECRCSGHLAMNAIPGNIVTENNNMEATEALRGCDLRWCEQNCRRMGFPGGVCVNGRCKCDIRYSDNPASPLSESNSDKNNLPVDVTFDTSVRSCINSQCNDICRRLGFATGVCISPTECRCSGHLAMNAIPGNIVTENNNMEATEAPRGCDLRWCEQNCRRMGFPGGVCVNGRCKCDIRYSDNPASALPESNSDKNNLPVDVTFDTSVRSCINSECNDICRRLGFATGVCISPTECRCSGHLAMNAIPGNIVTDSKKMEAAEAPRSCDLRWCEQNCRRMGFPGGVCVNGRCKCDIRYSNNPASVPSQSTSDISDEASKDVNADTKSVFREESNDIPQN